MLDNNSSSNLPEPNGYELQRAVERVDKNVHEGIAEIKVLIAGLVSRDLFDFESKVQNERILRLEQTVEKNETASVSAKQRFWLQTVIPLLMVATSIGVTLLNYHR